MFTGIVEELGEVVALERHGDVVALIVRAPLVTSDTRHGDSVAVNGVCLTVTDPGGATGETFRVDLVPETRKRSALAGVEPGTVVNLERALPLGGRLGGHIVQGHVDGVAVLLARSGTDRGAPPSALAHEATDEVRFALPADLARYVVEKGSITVDGVSLTVAAVSADTFDVALIPTTLAHTTLGRAVPGDRVNIEVDVLAKYVERLTVGYRAAGPPRSAESSPGEAQRPATGPVDEQEAAGR